MFLNSTSGDGGITPTSITGLEDCNSFDVNSAERKQCNSAELLLVDVNCDTQFQYQWQKDRCKAKQIEIKKRLAALNPQAIGDYVIDCENPKDEYEELMCEQSNSTKNMTETSTNSTLSKFATGNLTMIYVIVSVIILSISGYIIYRKLK